MAKVTTVLRRIAMAAVPLTASVLLATCGLDQLTGSSALADIALSTDTTVVVGATKTLAATAVDGTPLAAVRINWTSSSTTIATVDASGIVTGVNEGTALITATLTAPELPPEGLAATRTMVVSFGGLVVTPIDSLTGLGLSVTPTVRGTNAANVPVTVVTASLTSSDPTVLAVVGSAIVAKKNGTSTITATRGGLSALVTVRVRQVAKRITFAASPFVFRALARDTSVVVTVVDTRDSVIATPAITWTSQNAAAVTVSAAGVLRALQIASTTLRAVVDTAVGNLAVSVTQSPSSLSKTAGDGQTSVAGTAVTTLPTVTVTDAGGTPIAGVAVTFSVASGGGSITGAAQTSDATGKASVGSWTLGTTSGANSLLATVGTLTATFGATGIAGTATKLAIQQAPFGSSSVGAALAPVLQVAVRDVNNNLVTTATTAITVALAANPPSATLGGTTTVSAVAGVAAFDNLTVSAPGAGFTLAASAAGLTGATTATFNVAGPASKLGFTVQPANASAGSSIAPTIQISVQDAAGNTITGATNSVALTMATNPGAGTMTGGGAAAAVNGVASFASVSIDKSGVGYTITAAAAGLTSATSNTFNVVAGAANKLVYRTEPSNTSPATAITPAVQVAVTDALGNTVTSSTATVSIAIGTNPGVGALTGTSSVAAVTGVATFSTLQINNVGNGYTLVSSATGLAGAISGAFNIVGAGTPRALKFVTQPSTAVAGVSIAPSITVKVVDSIGTTVNSSTASITLSLAANPNTGTLSGTLTASAVGGVATFSTARVNRAGGGYTLAAVSSGLTTDTSAVFAISAGAATALAVTVQPTNVQVGAVIVPPVQISVLDNQGNVVPSATNTITVAVGTNPGGATLSGTLGVAASNGVATFANLSIPNAGTGYTLSAAATSLTSAVSAAFNVTTGSPKALVFVTEPSAATAAVAIAPAITVKMVDSLGATVASQVVAVTLTLNANPNGGTLSGTLTANTVNGVATFSTLSLNRAGGGYTLLATATGLTSDTSAVFAINTGTATALAFSVPPSNAVAGATIAPAVKVSVMDNQGNVVTSSTASIALAIGTNPGTATLTGGAATSAVAGVATFAGLSLNNVANGYTLLATSTGLTSSTSAAFNIAAGAPAVTVFTTQPATVNVNTAMSTVVVTVRDATGNTATSATMPVTLALLNNPSGAVLGGTLTQNAVAGVATFTGLTVDKPGQAYTLTATAAGSGGPLTPGTSSAFNGIGPATVLVFTTQPSSTVRNTILAPSIVVEGRDAAGNRATAASNAVTLTIATNPGSGTLGGTVTKNLLSGVATYTNLTINNAGTGYTLQATGTNLSSAISSAFDIDAFGAASKLAFVTQPTNVDVGAAISPDIQVAVQDAQGNTVTNSAVAVTLAFAANPGSATLGGTATVNAVSGVATFPGVSVSAAGTSYALTAAAAALTGATSATFNVVTAGSAIRLAFVQQPTTTIAGGVIVPSITVAALNGSGATVTSFIGTISLTIATGPGAGSLGGTLSVAAVSGVATFSSISIATSGSYTLRAAGASLTSAISSAFAINPGQPAGLRSVRLPTSVRAGDVLADTIIINVIDAQGNFVPTATTLVTLCGGTFGAGGCTTGAMGGTLSVAAVNGVARFTDVRPRLLSGYGTYGSFYVYRILATSAIGSTNYYDVLSAVNSAPASMRFLGSIGGTVNVGQNFGPRVVVQDSLGNGVIGSTNVVTATLGTSPTGATLGGITATNSTLSPYVNSSPGEATLSSLYVDKPGTYTIVVSSSGLGSLETSAVNVIFGAAVQLNFAQQPSTAAAGAAIAPDLRVAVFDQYGNTITTATGTVTLAIGANPGGGTLNGTKTQTLVNGVATFSGLSISTAGTGYTLTATTTLSGLSGSFTSATFNITP